uniref:Uncharacterized protein n=1 Tax=Lactuca sativa TaxID=4236 RepID=A0A9R1WTN3_LACSA|nr:hypothetical protein LSAT_V11C900491750 [Lactuca sativa]
MECGRKVCHSTMLPIMMFYHLILICENKRTPTGLSNLRARLSTWLITPPVWTLGHESCIKKGHVSFLIILAVYKHGRRRRRRRRRRRGGLGLDSNEKLCFLCPSTGYCCSINRIEVRLPLPHEFNGEFLISIDTQGKNVMSASSSWVPKNELLQI